jgi:hypothetical protein
LGLRVGLVRENTGAAPTTDDNDNAATANNFRMINILSNS